MCRECIRLPENREHVSLNVIRNDFIFSVESTGKRPLAPDAAGLSSVKRRHRAGARGAFPLNFAKKVETFSAFSRLYLWQGICYTVLCLPIQGIFSKEGSEGLSGSKQHHCPKFSDNCPSPKRLNVKR